MSRARDPRRFADLRVADPSIQAWATEDATEFCVYIDNLTSSASMRDSVMLIDEALCNWDSKLDVGISFQITVGAIFDSICRSYAPNEDGSDSDGRALAQELRRQCVETIARIDSSGFAS